MKKFIVKGTCLVPAQIEIVVEAESAVAAVGIATRSDWKSHIGTNDCDIDSAFDWEPYVEELVES